MPTPLGHALGGLATAWFSRAARDTRKPQTERALVAACVIAAVTPDIDILFHSHRRYTHSIGAVIIVGLVVWAIARMRQKQRPTGIRPATIALTMAAAYGTHTLLDWLGKDTAPPFGLMALWPFSSRFYLSGADLFMEISRRYWKPDEFILGNLRAVGWEVLVLGPIAVVAWWMARGRGEGIRKKG